MKYYNHDIEKLPLNKPIYGFAYNINDDTRNKRLSCLPVLGEIGENNSSNHKVWYQYAFYPYKKGINERKKSGIVEYRSRWYADTYEEAVEMYNELVQKRINNLKLMIEEAENDKIKE